MKKIFTMAFAAMLIFAGSAYAGSFTDNADGTVTDNVTGLMWQQEDDNLAYNWYKATGTADATYNPGGVTNVCGNLSLGGYSDWRLPSEKELESIIDGTYIPAIDTTAFPNTNASHYWSSTTHEGHPSHAWFVYFGNGGVGDSGKALYYYVRCVR